MPTRATPTHNLHSVDSHGGPLGVECRGPGCGRRAIVPGQAIGAHKGNMRELSTLRFVCQACGSRDWQGWLFTPREDALAWAREISAAPAAATETDASSAAL